MATTIEQLEQRVNAIEERLASVQAPSAPAQQVWNEMILRAMAYGVEPANLDLGNASVQQGLVKRVTDQAIKNAFQQIGPLPEPIGAEKLQKLVAADLARHGIGPNDNALSREIIAMREERG